MTSISEVQPIQTPAGATTARDAPSRWTAEKVVRLWHWTPRLLSFCISRPAAYRFTPGHYARVGLADPSGEVVWRPLSMVSGSADPWLEFVVAIVPGGPFSALVEGLKEGDEMLLDPGCFGFLTLDQLAPGKDLWLLASGTGIGPFVSILREPSTWQSFDHLIIVHSVRHRDELMYRPELEALGTAMNGTRARLHTMPVVTREPCPGALPARIPQLIGDGRLEAEAGVTLDVARSRVMVCGNPDLNRDLRMLFTGRGFQTNRRGVAGQIAFEKYW